MCDAAAGLGIQPEHVSRKAETRCGHRPRHPAVGVDGGVRGQRDGRGGNARRERQPLQSRDSAAAPQNHGRSMARDGLAGTRRALSALRGEVSPVEDYLRQLVAPAEPGEVTVAGERRLLTAEASQAVRRVAQEALTNVRKHAPGAGVLVRLEYLPGDARRGAGPGCGSDGPPHAALRRGGGDAAYPQGVSEHSGGGAHDVRGRRLPLPRTAGGGSRISHQGRRGDEIVRAIRAVLSGEAGLSPA